MYAVLLGILGVSTFSMGFLIDQAFASVGAEPLIYRSSNGTVVGLAFNGYGDMPGETGEEVLKAFSEDGIGCHSGVLENTDFNELAFWGVGCPVDVKRFPWPKPVKA